MDPTSIPVMQLIEPYLVMRGGNDDEVFPESKVFELNAQAISVIV